MKNKVNTFNSTIQVEPKKKNRFIIKFPEKFEVEAWSIQKTNKPIFSNGAWQNIKIEFIDTIGAKTASKSLYNIYQHVVASTDNSLLIEIQDLSPVGEVIESWEIISKVVEVNFGELDYNKDEKQAPYLIIKPKHCILKTDIVNNKQSK